MLLVKSVRCGGSGAPLDLGREVLQVLKALRFPDADAAGDPGTPGTPGTPGASAHLGQVVGQVVGSRLFFCPREWGKGEMDDGCM